MSFAETKETEAVNFVVGKRPLSAGSVFSSVAPAAPFSVQQPLRSGSQKPYGVVGNKHIAQQIVVAEKTRMAIDLTDRTLLFSVIDLTHTSQIAMAVAGSVQDPELREFIEDYVRQGLNYTTQIHAGYLETMRGKLNEYIQLNVEPTFGDKLRAFFGMS